MHCAERDSMSRKCGSGVGPSVSDGGRNIPLREKALQRNSSAQQVCKMSKMVIKLKCVVLNETPMSRKCGSGVGPSVSDGGRNIPLRERALQRNSSAQWGSKLSKMGIKLKCVVLNGYPISRKCSATQMSPATVGRMPCVRPVRPVRIGRQVSGMKVYAVQNVLPAGVKQLFPESQNLPAFSSASFFKSEPGLTTNGKPTASRMKRSLMLSP